MFVLQPFGSAKFIMNIMVHCSPWVNQNRACAMESSTCACNRDNLRISYPASPLHPKEGSGYETTLVQLCDVK